MSKRLERLQVSITHVLCNASAKHISVHLHKWGASMSAVVTLTLPVPPLLNHAYRRRGRGKPGMYLTQESHDFKAEVAAICWQAQLIPFTGDVEMDVIVYRPAKRGDWDGYSKLLCDSLQSFLYLNDAQITDIHWHKRTDKNNPRVELKAWEVQHDTV